MAEIFGLFVIVNIYAFLVTVMTKVMKDRHGMKKGFVISNAIILGVLLLVLLLAQQLGSL